jgi:FtsH-binding integral membrane protein
MSMVEHPLTIALMSLLMVGAFIYIGLVIGKAGRTAPIVIWLLVVLLVNPLVLFCVGFPKTAIAYSVLLLLFAIVMYVRRLLETKRQMNSSSRQ